MKIILKYFLMPLVLLISSSLYAQVGIGTTTPDNSSLLDVSSSSKGFLMPRLTTAQRDAITSPATGLMIFNTTLNDSQLNVGTPLVPSWIGVKKRMIDSVTEGDIISTTSTTNLLVSGMTVSAQTGAYLVLFAGTIRKPFSSSQGVTDMAAIYDQITALPGGIPHGLVFGNGETLPPGVHDVTGATSISGTLTLDGGGDPNSVFIIRSTGAFTTGATTTKVVLTNGASSNNIFWMSETTLSTGAGSIMKGTLVSPAGAIALGINTSLEGRMFTKAGAVNIGANSILTAPAGSSPIDLGVLSTLVMFSSVGDVSDDVTSEITGDVGTASGTIAIAGAHTGTIYPAGTSSFKTTTTYSIYQNGAELVNSRIAINLDSSVVSLQAMVNLVAGEAIEVQWKVDIGEAMLDNRTLSLINFGY
tara:strand:- start:21017 stop:22267 length:1251 start_codon:yes stop_codon:yes gene_type:complete